MEAALTVSLDGGAAHTGHSTSGPQILIPKSSTSGTRKILSGLIRSTRAPHGGTEVFEPSQMPRCSVLVPMILMGSVPAAIVDVVDMISVRDAHVAATFAVPVRMVVMPHVARGLAFVDVCLVWPVQVPVMGVVDVVGVRYGDMAAFRPVRVIVTGVLLVLCHRCHLVNPLRSRTAQRRFL